MHVSLPVEAECQLSPELNASKLQEGLNTSRFGRSIVFARRINSTSQMAKELATYGAAEGTVVIAETQTAGHGRHGKKWFSPTGGLWLSVILRPKLEASDAVKLVFLAGLAVTQTLSELYGISAETKWPNDVLVNGRKICGILSEMSTRNGEVKYVIIGVGVNANVNVSQALPNELKKNTTSLQNELGKRVKLEELFKTVIGKMEKLYDIFLEHGSEEILREWKKHAFFVGRKVQITGENEELEGLALDVDLDGALIIQLSSGEVKRIIAGEISLIIPS